MTEQNCHIVQTSRGPVRVNGSIDPETLEVLAQQVAAMKARECGHVGPIPMPEIAQRMHGRETYLCGLDKGHDGPHEWSGRTWPTNVEEKP